MPTSLVSTGVQFPDSTIQTTAIVGHTNTASPFETALGFQAGNVNSGVYNTFIGYQAGLANTGASSNTALGAQSLFTATTAVQNTAVGAEALYTAGSAASWNTAVGYQALYSVNSGTDNTAIGWKAGYGVTTGINNTLLGERAGYGTSGNLTTGSNNTVIGFTAAASSSTVSNEITLGNSSVTSFRIPGLSVTWNANTVPYRNLPPSGTRTTSYTLTTSDVGKYVQVSTGGSITIPTSTFAEGDAITLFNNTTGNITITCSAPTAYIAGTNTVKTSMTLATRGVATILFISATLCVVTGNVS